jgi:superfamily II DNA/RNA helicase
MAPEIRRLADAFLQNPKEITVSKPATVATTITEAMALVAEHDKREALRRLVRSEDVQNALIFCNRKRDVDILYKSLTRHNFSVGALHGDMSQPVRFATLEKFKSGDIRLLCCSDVAARGLDIGGLSHVFNFDVPIHAEDYVHRIGRTGRAGNEGRAFTLATAEDRLAVESIQKLTGHPIPRIDIEGLDTVAWAEGDGRKRRGRKPAEPKRAAARKDDAPKPARREPKPKAEPIAARAPVEAPAPVAEQPRPQPQPKAAEPKRRDDRRRAEHAPEPRPEPRPEARPDRDRPDRRDRDRDRRRDDDFGPTVVGFGTDIPAFMLVAARPRRTHAPAADLLTVDDREA